MKSIATVATAILLCFIAPNYLTCASNSLRASDRPNIVYILADDLGYGDLGCYNADSKIPTPRLDKLATQGMRFTDAHSPSSVCTPTRYALLTGRYAWRTRLQRNVLGPWDKPLIAAERLTVGKLLQQHGYESACVGKWHLGQTYGTTDGKPAIGGVKQALNNVDFTKPISDGPITRGFDHYFGTIVPNYPPYCFIEDDRTVGLPSLPMAGANFNIPGPAVPDWKLEDILPQLTSHAVRWIEEREQTEKPFFLYFSLTSPHYPVVPAPEFIGKTKVGAYGDFVYQTDWSIGQVLDALDRTGLADNTLVIFTSDNGAEITGEVKPGAYDRVQKFEHRSSGELRGAKRDAWEGGHRVPFIARWPGKIKPGTSTDETVCHVDLLATVAAMLGQKLPDNAAEDSVSILPVLLGEQLDAPVREATVHHSARGKFAIRQGDWVLIDAPSGDDNGANGEPSWLKTERGYTEHAQPGELFNVRDDLSQRNNLYAAKPEIVSKLKALLEKYKEDGRSTPGTPQPNDVNIQPYAAVRAPIKPSPGLTKPRPRSNEPEFSKSDQVERVTRDISGWQVHISKKLLESESADTGKALVGLEKMLAEIVRVVPAAAVTEMKKVPLYFSPSYKPGRSGAEFHPGAGWLRDNGRDPEMAQGVEFSGVHDFEAEMRRMPNFALHELAHAFHFRALPDGFDNTEIKVAYQRAKESGLYDRVERSLGNGQPNTFERAYAMTTAMEYFAETTEAYFSRNDFFPFTREELLRHDPEMHALLEKLWGVSDAKWLTNTGGEGPGKGKHIVLIAAEQEYRSEQSMPMMAKILATHHGFDCTVLFGVNGSGEVDPTLPVYPEKGKEFEFKEHHIPGLEQLASADLVIFCTRLLTLPKSQLDQIVKYVDSGKPIIALRTANHGFRRPLPYNIDGKQVRWGEDVLGGTFLNHHGRWHADSTRGFCDKAQTQHPIMVGVDDIWGDSDVYRTYAEGSSLPADCTALVWGQPLMGRKPDDRPNDKLEPLPVAWVKPWRTSHGSTARVFHCTMGSGTDFKSQGLRRLVVNAAYWCVGLEASISATRSVDIVGSYEPLESGFNYEELGVKPRPVTFYK